MHIHLPGFRKRWGDAAETIIGLGVTTGDMCEIPDAIVSEFLSRMGVMSADPAAMANWRKQTGGCNGCGQSPVEGL